MEERAAFEGDGVGEADVALEEEQWEVEVTSEVEEATQVKAGAAKGLVGARRAGEEAGARRAGSTAAGQEA